MDDKNEQVYSQYQLDINNVYKKRGFIYLDTKDSLYVVKPYNYTEKRASFENAIKNTLVERGFKNIDLMIKNNNGSYLSSNRYGNNFVVKRWFYGEECDITNIEHVIQASKNLAELHMVMQEIIINNDDIEYVPKKNILNEYNIYNNELKRVKKYIYNKKRKNRLEVQILRYIDEYKKEADYYYDRLRASNYERIYSDAIKNNIMCHGNYTHHSVIMLQDSVATINFDKIAYGIHIYDLYCLLRKTMEKNKWDANMGIQLIDAYNSTKVLNRDEKELLYIFLAYPDKFRKLVNSYYNGKKSLVSTRISEKLDELVDIESRKKDFLNEMKKCGIE